MTLNSLINRSRDQDVNRTNLIQTVLQDGMQIESLDTIKVLLKEYPNEPSLYKMYADVLEKDGIYNASSRIYAKAADLYLAKGEILSATAIVAVQSQAKRLKECEISEFFTKLKTCSIVGGPIDHFLGKLNLKEFLDLIENFMFLRYQSGQIINQIGNPDDKLIFVVAGRIKDSLYLTIDNDQRLYRKPTIHLTAGDYFGSIYPFDRPAICKSYIEATANSELISISKDHLKKLCSKYPNVERHLINLLRVRSANNDIDSYGKLRAEKRIKLRLEFGLEVLLGKSSKSSIYVTGNSRDVSIGGICFVFDDISISSASEIPRFEELLNDSNVLVNFQIEELTIKLPGKIVWSKSVMDEGTKTLAVGVKFEEMSPMLKGLILSIFNCLNVGHP